MDDKFNLSDEKFKNSLLRRQLRCGTCRSNNLTVTADLGCNGSVIIKCANCGRKTQELSIIEAVGSEKSVATIVTVDSLLKAIKTSLKKARKR